MSNIEDNLARLEEITSAICARHKIEPEYEVLMSSLGRNLSALMRLTETLNPNDDMVESLERCFNSLLGSIYALSFVAFGDDGMKATSEIVVAAFKSIDQQLGENQ